MYVTSTPINKLVPNSCGQRRLDRVKRSLFDECWANRKIVVSKRGDLTQRPLFCPVQRPLTFLAFESRSYGTVERMYSSAMYHWRIHLSMLHGMKRCEKATKELGQSRLMSHVVLWVLLFLFYKDFYKFLDPLYNYETSTQSSFNYTILYVN